MLNLASWNVNSLKVRLPHVLQWLSQQSTDVLALQETKVTDENFPLEAIQTAGFEVVYSGQKTYNGVAVISRLPLTDPITDLSQFDDPQRRILAVTVNGIRVINLYVPNGASVDSDKYQYKLTWLQHVSEFIRQQLQTYDKVAVVGDFNIAPADMDVHDPKDWEGDVLVSEPERAAFANLIDLGLTDSFRYQHPETSQFSWWDYRAASFRRNRGLRIDHILCSSPLRENLIDAGIDKEPRKWEKPSDHAPVWATFDLP